MASTLNKSQIRSEAKAMIRKGTSKQATYDLLSEKYKEKITIAKIVQWIPSRRSTERYMTANIFLLIIICITTLLDLFAFSLPGVALDIYMIVLVATRTAEQYSWITARAFFSLIQIGALFILLKNNTAGADREISPALWIFAGVILVLSISSMTLGFYLGKRLCPEYHERKIVYTDPMGKKRVRIEHEFDE